MELTFVKSLSHLIAGSMTPKKNSFHLKKFKDSVPAHHLVLIPQNSYVRIQAQIRTASEQ